MRRALPLRLPPGAGVIAALLALLAAPVFAAGPGTPAFIVGGGTQVRLSGATRLALDCDLRNYGSFVPAEGAAVVLRGYGAPLLAGTGTLADLTVALGSAAGTAAIANPVAVMGTLSLAQGRLSLAGHDLEVYAIGGGSAASYVLTPDTLGRLVRSVGADANVVFPVGNAAYDPLVLRTGTGSDVFRVAVLDGPTGPGLDPQSALTRAWAVAHPHAPGVNGALTYAVTWNEGEYGSSFDRSLGQPASAWAWRWLDVAWVPQANVRRTDNGVFPAVDTLVTLHAGLWTLGGISQLLGADPPEPAAPRALELAPAFPNPARGATTVRFGLPQRTRVTVALYSVLGERVATLADGEREAGWHLVRHDDARLPAGIYFVRLQAGSDARTAKLVITR